MNFRYLPSLSASAFASASGRFFCLLVVALIGSGCASGPSATNRFIARGATIHQAIDALILPSTRYETVDGKGQRVVLVRDYLYTPTMSFDDKDRQRYVKTWRSVCESAGNQWKYLPESAAKVSRFGFSLLGAAFAVNDWYATRGIQIDPNSLFIEASTLDRQQQQYASRWNAVLTDLIELENYGEFHCLAADGKLRWSLFRDFAGIAVGDPRSSINPEFGYSLDYRMAFTVVEAQTFKPGKDGGLRVAEKSRSLPTSGWYVVLEKSNGRWAVKTAKPFDYRDDKRPDRGAGEELLVISQDLNFTMPLFAGAWSNLACERRTQLPTATYTVCNTGFAKKESTPMLLTALALLGANIKTDVIDRETKSVTFEPTLVSAAIAEAQVEEVIRARLSGTK